MMPLTIGFPYVADRFGGSNASSLVLARALQDAGHRVRILTHGGDGRVADEAASLCLRVTRLPPLSGVPGYARPDRFRVEQLTAFRAARRAIAELPLDIVHTNDLTMLRAWAMPALAARIPLVAHWRSNFRESWSVKAGLHAAAKVIAVSGYSFSRLPAWVRRKGVVEFNAFDLHMPPAERLAARAGLRRRLDLPPNAAIVGVFGNHVVRKRTHVLADVVANIAATADGRPVFGLACGGRAEPYDHELDSKIAVFGLEQRLLRPGFVRPVEGWMAGCDAILAPATDEPLARNVLEAMALEIPAIVSTDGGLPELVRDGKNGLLRDPYDISGWIAATRRILDQPDFAARLAAAGRATVADLTPERHAARVASVYRSIPQFRSRAA
jgi:glycosyltransferase involved in cell wall biosynthesis